MFISTNFGCGQGGEHCSKGHLWRASFQNFLGDTPRLPNEGHAFTCALWYLEFLNTIGWGVGVEENAWSTHLKASSKNWSCDDCFITEF